MSCLSIHFRTMSLLTQWHTLISVVDTYGLSSHSFSCSAGDALTEHCMRDRAHLPQVELPQYTKALHATSNDRHRPEPIILYDVQCQAPPLTRRSPSLLCIRRSHRKTPYAPPRHHHPLPKCSLYFHRAGRISAIAQSNRTNYQTNAFSWTESPECSRKRGLPSISKKP